MSFSATIEGNRNLMTSPRRKKRIASLASSVDVSALLGCVATQIYVETGGTLFSKLVDDAEYESMDVADKSYHVGRYAFIGSTGVGTTAAGITVFGY
jgi:hypothetical protein